MSKERMEIGFCAKKRITVMGTSCCSGTLIATPKMPKDNHSMEYIVHCNVCKRWWETMNPLRMMARLSKKS